MGEFIAEFWAFLKFRKKLWLTPIVAFMVMLGVLVVIAKGSILAPFLYTVF